MSVSVYYSAKRAYPLSAAEIQAINALLKAFNANKGASSCEDMDFYAAVGEYGGYEDGVLLQGAPKPSLNLFNARQNMLHILASLSAMKRALPASVWDVSLDDLSAHWDEEQGFYFD